MAVQRFSTRRVKLVCFFRAPQTSLFASWFPFKANQAQKNDTHKSNGGHRPKQGQPQQLKTPTRITALEPFVSLSPGQRLAQAAAAAIQACRCSELLVGWEGSVSFVLFLGGRETGGQPDLHPPGVVHHKGLSARCAIAYGARPAN